MNITLPREAMARLRKKPNRSAFVALAVREKLDSEEKARRERALAEAYRQASEIDADLIDDWDGPTADNL